jgi:uncharacterized protein (TIGR02217 family)
MTFSVVQFPNAIALGATGGPNYSTDIVTNFAGYEQRNVNWSQSRGRWNVASGIKSNSDMATLIAFFRARQGRAIGFRFKDYSDYEVIAGNIGTGDDTETEFQLSKQYTSGSATVNRTITKLVAGTYAVYIDTVVQTETTDYTIDTTTGIVTFISAPATDEVITADFEFDIPVRFDTDSMEISQDYSHLSNWGNIPVIEIRG